MNNITNWHDWSLVLFGIAIGWITKVPFLIKWYRELKRTKTYEKAKNAIEYKAMVERYNTMYPNRAIKLTTE